MSTTHVTRRALVCLGAAFAIITAGCSSSGDPVPGTTTPTGSSTPMAMDTNGAAGPINRTDPTAVATSFATYFAAGDTPSACKLLNTEGIASVKDRISGFCENRQAWAVGAPIAAKHCSDGHGGQAYDFDSGMVYDSYRAIEVQLSKAQNGEWAVYSLGLADNSGQLSCAIGG